MAAFDDQIQRRTLKDSLRGDLENTIGERVSRYLGNGHQNIIGAHHFATASTECIFLYRTPVSERMRLQRGRRGAYGPCLCSKDLGPHFALAILSENV